MSNLSPELSKRVCGTAVWILACAWMIVSVGCSTLGPTWSDLQWPMKSEPKLPTIVLPIWTDTVLHQPGKPGIRGFGGRVYFYENEGDDPIKVDGSITVYVFDGEDHNLSNAKPLRKFVITADQLSGHHSVSDLGHSYSVWVPWDRVGGASRTFSLITRFDGRNGGTAVSNAANKLLPGVPKTAKKNVGDEEDEAGSKSQGVQQAAFVKEAEPLNLSPAKTKPYSMTLPSSFQRHLNRQTSQTLSAQVPSPNFQAVESKTVPFSARAERPEFEVKTESAVDSSRWRFPARREPKFLPGVSPLRKSLHRAGWPSALPPTPRSVAPRPVLPTAQAGRQVDSQQPADSRIGSQR